MANRAKGEVAVDVDGASVVLVLDFNAICELEGALGLESISGLGDLLQKGSAKTLRLVVWAAMLRCRPQAVVADAGPVIDAVGADLADVVNRLCIDCGLFGDPVAASGAGGGPEK